MTKSLRRRRPTHRRPVQSERPVLRLPIADPFDDRDRRHQEAQRHDEDDEPERGVAVIDFYI